MRKQKITVLILMITLCLAGIWGMKKNTTVWGGVIQVNDVIVPHDIPAVAVEINKSSEQITEKLSQVFYTVYTEADTLHIPVSWGVSSVNMKLAGVYTVKGVLKLPQEYAFEGNENLQVQTTVSVQYPDKPDINTYYRLTAAGIYIFPWLKQENSDSMEAYLKKESGQWINLTEEGFALCEEEGLYVSNQSMVVGNTYSLLVTYDNGKKQTNTLRFQYQRDGSLKIYGYQYSQLGNTGSPAKRIRSYNAKDEKYLSRCAAYAVEIGSSLRKIEEDLKEGVRLRVSTAEKFENTAENPEIILESSWDMSQVDLTKQGVYKLTGTFVVPEGYQLSEDLALPKAYAYLSVQKKGYPQINTYSMPVVDLVEFPMLMAGFSAEELQNVQVYIRENKGSYQKLDRELAEVTSKGIQLYCREVLKKGNNYDICAVYETGSTGIYSFSYNDEFIVNEYWHERNFSDRDEKNLPAIVQKAPGQTATPVPSVGGMESPDTKENYYEESSGETSDNSKNSGQKASAGETKATGSGTISDFDAADSTVTELSTDTVTAVSGQRLLLMLQQNGSVRFEKQGISVTILPEAINTWKVAANDEIQMKIEKTAESAFSLRIFVRGEEVTEIPGSTVEFQTSVFGEILSPETVTVVDAQGNLCAVTWQDKQKILRVEIEKTGDYFLSDDPAGGQTDKTETNLTESSVSDADEDTEAILDGVMTEEVTTEGLSEKQKKKAVKLIKRIDFTGEICGLLSIATVGLILFLILRRKRNNRRNR
ncbi:hypothetical protein [Blautia difficilis]|uniref:Uncharacterized protein n=1 Tax=Blautia difficilis TaxID=2763027 RepID=A0ABR7IIA2_9FIRM|nr:hypothetical protein [Blautia difficilis]MBC5779712.1 hypothetical protein [Blautia difficilis]